jgi:hypothetical protein
MTKRFYSHFISRLIEGKWLESSTGVLGVILGLVFEIFLDVNIVDHNVLYSTMVRVSIGLLTMSSIIVNLAGALSLRTHRIASSAIIISKMSFAPIIALLVSCCIGFLLLVFDQSLIRIVRYCLAGGWCGLVFGASIRSVLLGMRILVVNLQTHLNANDQPKKSQGLNE